MTDKKTEALKLALEALEWIAAQRTGGMIQRKAMEAITALREALAEQLAQDNTYNYAKSLAEAIFKQHFASDEHYASGRIVFGVNDTVIGILTQIDNMVADMVRRPAQQEPVKACVTGHCPCKHECDSAQCCLYTSPPASKPWVGLTDGEYRRMWSAVYNDTSDAPSFLVFAQAIEAKLKEKNT